MNSPLCILYTYMWTVQGQSDFPPEIGLHSADRGNLSFLLISRSGKIYLPSQNHLANCKFTILQIHNFGNSRFWKFTILKIHDFENINGRLLWDTLPRTSIFVCIMLLMICLGYVWVWTGPGQSTPLIWSSNIQYTSLYEPSK